MEEGLEAAISGRLPVSSHPHLDLTQLFSSCLCVSVWLSVWMYIRYGPNTGPPPTTCSCYDYYFTPPVPPPFLHTQPALSALRSRWSVWCRSSCAPSVHRSLKLRPLRPRRSDLVRQWRRAVGGTKETKLPIRLTCLLMPSLGLLTS